MIHRLQNFSGDNFRKLKPVSPCLVTPLLGKVFCAAWESIYRAHCVCLHPGARVISGASLR